MKVETSKITERGQVTIPENFRKRYGLTSGNKVLFIEEHDGIFMKSVKNVDLKELERMFRKTEKIKPRFNLSAEEMDKLNEGEFR